TSSDASWLSVNPTSGSVPSTLSVEPSISGLSAGTYSAAITITPSQGQPQTVTVSLIVSPAPTVPGPPTNVSAAPENGSAVVSWAAPSDGGSPISYYTVTPFVGSTPQPGIQVSNSPPSTSATIPDLTNGTAYTFTVTASNAIGTGASSNPSAPVIPTAAAAPTLDVDVSAHGNSSTTTPPFNTSQPGETLVAFVSEDGPATTGGQTSAVTGGGLTWKLDALANTQYGAAAVWSATAASALSNVTVTAAEGKTGYDQMLTVTSFENSGGVGAVMTAGAASGAPSTTLTTTNPNSLVYGVGNDYDRAIARTAGPNQTVTNQWVDTGNGDTFWVQDQNAPVAAGGSSTTINDTSPTTDRWNMAGVEILGSAPVAPTVPSAPTGVSAVAGSQSATVSWAAPPDGGSPITSYAIIPYAGSVPQTPTTVTGNPPATSVDVTGLTNGTAYTFTVTATNAIGNSAASPPSPAVTPANSTSPVRDVDVTVNGTGTSATAAFSTSQASEVLVAFVSADGPQGTQTTAVSGAGLTWSQTARANTQYGTAEIWTATATSLLSNVTVTSTESAKGFHQSLTVLSFSGSGGVGAANSAGATSGAPTISITTTKNTSLVYAVGEDWDNAIARTVGTGQSMVSQRVDTSIGGTFWVQQITYPVASPALVMLNDTAPTTDRWNLAAVEVTGS
ncbi:MAG: fibronectin type III domain-containing protein, partial [Acidimicrobiaceae bacterium]|nr:fibronectin type III domain-containing protein [Acidimicrobiaceae bacterium]